MDPLNQVFALKHGLLFEYIVYIILINSSKIQSFKRFVKTERYFK